MNDYSADQLNLHLFNGGVVQVSTYLKSTVYTPKHAGYFLQLKDGALAVRRGRSVDRLSVGGRITVAIRLGNYN